VLVFTNKNGSLVYSAKVLRFLPVGEW
jgi:hypothetical protein